MDVTKTIITVLYLMFPALLKAKQTLNVQGNVA